MQGEELVAVGFENPQNSQVLWIANSRLVEDETLAEGFSPYKQKYRGIIGCLRQRYKHLKHWKVVYKDFSEKPS